MDEGSSERGRVDSEGRIPEDELLQRVNEAGDGCLQEFTAITEPAGRTGRPSMYQRLKRRLPSSFVKYTEDDRVSRIYQEKCKQLGDDPTGGHDKVQETAHPLGCKLRPPTNVEIKLVDTVYDSEVPDPDPLITHATEEIKLKEIHRQQRRTRAIELRRVRDDFRFWDEGEDGAEALRTTVETPDNLSHDLGPTQDCLEYAARKYWKIRRHLTKEGTILVRFRLLMCSCLQFAAGIALFCLGAGQLEGGDIELLTTSLVCACVQVAASFLLLFASLPESPNEQLTFCCYTTEIWLIFLLVSCLLADVSYINEMEKQCTPTLQTYTARDSCNERASAYSMIILIILDLAVVYVATFSTIELLDKSNKRASMADKFLLFKYRHTLLRELQTPLVHHGIWDHTLRVIVSPNKETPPQPSHENPEREVSPAAAAAAASRTDRIYSRPDLFDGLGDRQETVPVPDPPTTSDSSVASAIEMEEVDDTDFEHTRI